MTTLDGVERDLNPSMLMIADADRSSAVAGVMGGAETEISPHHKKRPARERKFQSALRSERPHVRSACQPKRPIGSNGAPTSKWLDSHAIARLR